MTDELDKLNVDDPGEVTQNYRKMIDDLSKTIDPAELSRIGFVPGNDLFRLRLPEFNIPETVSFRDLSYEEQIRHNEKQEKILEEIRDNTAPLSAMLQLIAENRDSQNEILKIVNQIFELATARNIEELKNKHWKVIEDINNIIELGKVSGNLILFAQTIFNFASQIIKQ